MAITYGKNYGRPTLDLNFAENKSLIDSVTGRNLITFSRSQSGKEATYVGSDGLIKYAGADEPRFDYDPTTGESLGLLVEESSTNEWSNSESLLGGTNGYTLPGGLTNPAGGSTAVKILPGSTQTWWDRGTIFESQSGFAVTSGDYWTMSWWAYSTNQSVDFGNSDYFSVANTTISQDKTVSVGQWKRCYRTVQFTESGSPQIRFMPYNYTLYTNTNNEVFVWGFQFEKKLFPTSYIPTRGSTVTRNADEASITGTNFSSWYNQSEGTIFHDGRYIGDVLGGNYGVINGLIFYFRNTGLDNFANQWSLGIYRAAGISNPPNHSSALYNGTTLVLLNVADQLANNPVGSRMKSVGFINTSTGEFGHVLNGGTIRSNSNTNIPIWDKLSISQAYNNQSRCGHISRFTYWPKRLPDLELQQLTK